MKSSDYFAAILVLTHGVHLSESLLFASHGFASRPLHSKCFGNDLLRQSNLHYRQRSKGTATYSMIIDTLIQRVFVKNFVAWRSAITQTAAPATITGAVGIAMSILPNFFYVLELSILGYMVYAAVLAVSPLFFPILWSGGDDDIPPPIRGKRCALDDKSCTFSSALSSSRRIDASHPLQVGRLRP